MALARYTTAAKRHRGRSLRSYLPVSIMNDSFKNDESQFQRLMGELRSGSEEAAEELLRVYGDHIYRVVRQRMHQRMRTRFDSADFVQIVWQSFFAHLDEISRFQRPQDLIRFLARVATNKVVDEVRRSLVMQKANVNRERSLNDSQTGVHPQLRARGNTASETAIAKEFWNRITRDQPARHIQILAMRAEGATIREIAREVKLNERTVRRIIRSIAIRLSELHEYPGP